MFVPDEVSEVREIFRGLHDDVAAVATVPAVRSTARNVGFPAKTQAAIAAVAGFAEQFNLVDKHRRKSRKGLVVPPQDTEASKQNVGSVPESSDVAVPCQADCHK